MLLPDQYTEKNLLQLVSQGDEKAFRVLFDHHWGNIFGLALAFTKSQGTAEEITQDIFLKVWLAREKLHEIDCFDNYLFILSRNHILNTLRRKIKESSFAESLLRHFSDEAYGPEELLILKQSEQLVDSAIRELPLQQRTIFSMSRHHGLSHEEIADKLHISKNTVKSHVNRAIHTLRLYLEKNSAMIATILWFSWM